MTALYFIALLFLYVPVVLGYLKYLSIIDYGKELNPISFLIRKYRYSNHEYRYMLSLSIIFISCAPAAVYLRFINPTNGYLIKYALSSIIATSIASAILIIKSEHLKKFFSTYKVLINIGIGLFIAVNTAKAMSYAEFVIVKLTGVLATDLPTAMVWLNLLLVPLAWALSITIIALVGYAATLFLASANGNEPLKYSTLNCPRPKSKSRHIEQMRLYTIALCMCLLTLIPILAISMTTRSSWFETTIREQLVRTSFHLKGKECGFDKLADAPLAFISRDKAVIAIPHDKYTYEFKRVECKMSWEQPSKIEAELKESSSENKQPQEPATEE